MNMKLFGEIISIDRNNNNMVVLVNSYGNHSNILFQNMHLELFCSETKQKFINLGELDDFEGLYKQDCFFPIQLRKLLSFMIRIGIKFRLIQIIHFDDLSESFDSVITKLGKKRIHFIAGWGIRMNQLTEKAETHQIYGDRFDLKANLFENNELFKWIQQLKIQNKKVVGIHIRRSDYQRYLGGKYYYTIPTYIEIIKTMKSLLFNQSWADSEFVVFSNDDISDLNIEKLYISKEVWYIDQKLMTCCDYLIGPPSTFTGWASYIGNVLLYHIEDQNFKFKLDDFFVMND